MLDSALFTDESSGSGWADAITGRRDHLIAGLRQFLDAGDPVYRGRIENCIRHRNSPPLPMGA